MAQSGPSTTMVPIQNGQIKVKFIGATQAAVPWQLVMSKSFAAKNGITQSSDPETIIPKLKGAKFAGVTGPTDSIATVQGYVLSQYGVAPSDVSTNYLGSPTAMLADVTAGRSDAYIDPLGQAFQAATQSGAVYVNLADLKKVPYLSAGIPSFFTVPTSLISDHPDTLNAFQLGMWKAWQYVQDPSHHSDLVAYIQKQYPGTPTEAADYSINFFAKHGILLSQSGVQNSINLANTTLKPPLTVTFDQVATTQFQDAAVKALGITPPQPS
jgi:ABC-type nitrate/sulfonate/bicarbonate transport system substrate-binding protein